MAFDIPAALLSVLLHLFPACPTEDSAGCGWNAQAQGNGIGRSFITLTDEITIR